MDLAKELWVSPQAILKGPDGNRAWDNAGNITPNTGARFLELADIALGHKKPVPPKKKATALDLHQRKKTRPYSN